MKILEYTDLDTSHVESSYHRVIEAIRQDDFRAAHAKKLMTSSHGKLYRAKLNDADRLLFSIIRHGNEVYALMLEIIRKHDYNKSRFLRGAIVDEACIPDFDPAEAIAQAESIRYLHKERTIVHFLNKPLSFDDAQESIYRHPAPLIIVGSAGSGKTALTLEKIKPIEGEILYVTNSAFLAKNARDLYYYNRFENQKQEVVFWSYLEFIESIHIPSGREATWKNFSGWFERVRQGFKEIDSHQVFEEFRGVISAGFTGVLSREEYQALGIRQSIFPVEKRDAIYDLFLKYRSWLESIGLFDLNLIAKDWQTRATPRYDFIVIDEVQDITAIQLILVLKTLKRSGNFLLCGDSNQIVHPNFFSWSKIKSLFWLDPTIAERQELRVLTTNFRNGLETTRVANQLLKIKHQRFGSIDRESNFLIQSVGESEGQVFLMQDKDGAKKELNGKIQKSTHFAVLVMRDEDKAEARRFFSTPLLFSIHEVKGLEYENIILYRFVSNYRIEFSEIVDGVEKRTLTCDAIDYCRPKDKSDKSLEVYKFFVNALYVALTRAIQNLYIIESDTGHALFDLLDINIAKGQVKVEAKEASLEEWQQEAHKLELQGKREQAEAIRRDILKFKPVPWPVFDQFQITELLAKVFQSNIPHSQKYSQQLCDFAACYDLPELSTRINKGVTKNLSNHGKKSYLPYFAKQYKEILRQCDQYGIEHRLIMNQTPLMAAAAAGNIPLVKALLERSANCEAVDTFGQNALHWAMREAFKDEKIARGPFAELYELLAPTTVDINTGERLISIHKHLSEYFLLQTFWVLFKPRFLHPYRELAGAFNTKQILNAWKHLPANVVRPERSKREHLSAVLSRNEIDRSYAYNRMLFWRVAQGWYRINPKLSVKKHTEEGETWILIYEALNLPFIVEFAVPQN
ncbi:ANK_REP_REGION domain-containing protein [Gammaproteobacteria bacterium]